MTVAEGDEAARVSLPESSLRHFTPLGRDRLGPGGHHPFEPGRVPLDKPPTDSYDNR